MRTVTLAFVCFLAFAPTAFAAGGSSAGEGAAKAALDFSVRIPHSLHLLVSPLANSASGVRAGTAQDGAIGPMPQGRWGARPSVVTILSTYRHVTIVRSGPGRPAASPPRGQAEMTEYGTVRIRIQSPGSELLPASLHKQPSLTAPGKYTVVTP